MCAGFSQVLCQEGGFAHVIVKDISTVTVERAEFLVFVLHALLRIQTTGTEYKFYVTLYSLCTVTTPNIETTENMYFEYMYIET